MYLIESVERKDESEQNKYHDVVRGKRCSFEQISVSGGARLLVEGLLRPDVWSWYRTSSVLAVLERDGCVYFETRNSVYTLREISDEEKPLTSEN